MIYLEPDQWTSDDDIDTDAIQMPTGQYIMDSANNPWSFSSPDNNVLRFEVQPGDHWFNDPSTSERDEIGGTTQVPYGTPVDVSYSFMVEPGAANTAAWLVLGQLHQVDYAGEVSTSPPVAIMMVGEKMAVQIGWTDSTGVNRYTYIYTSPTDIVRGQYYSMNIDANVDPAGGGRLLITCNGQTIVNYTGPLGIADHTGVFWKEGIYEAASPEIMAVDYKNLAITTGASIPSATTTTPSVTYSRAANDVVSAETVTNSDQSRDVYDFNMTGAYYVSSHLHYNTQNHLTATVDYNANGARSFAQVTNSDSSELTTYYDASGDLTKSVKNYTDGVCSVLDYLNGALSDHFIENPNGSSVYETYNPSGALTGVWQKKGT